MNAYCADLPDLPTKEDVETALTKACDLDGTMVHARHYAFRALTLAFPDLSHAAAADLVAPDERPAAFTSANARCETLLWWKDYILDEVLNAIANAPGQR